MTYTTAEQAMTNATRLMQAGAQMVKMEGGTWLSNTISMLVERGIPVRAHLGLTPVGEHLRRRFKVQGRTPSEAKSILADAVEIQDAGASLLVLECIPATRGRYQPQTRYPGDRHRSGAGTDAQVLVMHDLLGFPRTRRFVQNFMEARTTSGRPPGFRQGGRAGLSRGRAFLPLAVALSVTGRLPSAWPCQMRKSRVSRH